MIGNPALRTSPDYQTRPKYDNIINPFSERSVPLIRRGGSGSGVARVQDWSQAIYQATGGGLSEGVPKFILVIIDFIG